MPINRNHDKFYTRPDTVTYCLGKLFAYDQFCDAFFLEPSAGAGAFLDALPRGRSLGLDIEPAHPAVHSRDFLAYAGPDRSQWARLVVVGNPPFGRNSSLAVKFFNKAAQLADVIAFILPKTFQKLYTQRRLDERFHLVQEFELPDESFLFEEHIWTVPCVFQIWVRRAHPRVDSVGARTHPDFRFVRKDMAQFAVRRVGRSAGKVFTDFAKYSAYNHHFLAADDPESVKCILESIDWTAVRQKTAGVPCVGKEELIRLYVQRRSKAGAAEKKNPSTSEGC